MESSDAPCLVDDGAKASEISTLHIMPNDRCETQKSSTSMLDGHYDSLGMIQRFQQDGQLCPDRRATIIRLASWRTFRTPVTWDLHRLLPSIRLSTISDSPICELMLTDIVIVTGLAPPIFL
jgi:hypothetical protein